MVQNNKQELVRLTIDLPVEQHAYLKILAAKGGVSMRQYVLNALSQVIAREEHQVVDFKDPEFKKKVNAILEEYDDLFKNLAKK